MGKVLVGASNNAALTTSNGAFSAWGASGASVGATAVEASAAIPMPAAGTLSGLASVGAQTGTWSATLRKNGAAGNQTISNGAPADATHTDAVVAGDKIDLTWGAGGGTVTALQGVFLATSSHWALYFGSQIINGNSLAAGATGYGKIGGTTPGLQSTESTEQLQIGTAGTLSGMAVMLATNATTSASTATFRKNGAGGSQTVTIGAGLTGLFQDTTHSDAVAQGDLVAVQFVNGGGGALTCYACGCAFQNTAAPANDLFGFGWGSVTAGATWYARLFGSTATGQAESAVQIAHGFQVSTSRMAVLLVSNATTAASTATLRKNGAAANQTLTIGAGLTGWFTDTTHADAFGAADLAAYQFVSGGGGAAGVNAFVLTENSQTSVALTAAAGVAGVGVPGSSPRPGLRAAAASGAAAGYKPQIALPAGYPGGVLGLAATDANLVGMEGSAFDAVGGYVYVTPHNNYIVAKVDPQTFKVVATVDLHAVLSATGAFLGCRILNGFLYIFPHITGASATQIIVRIDLSNFTGAGCVALDLKACGIGVTSSYTWTGGEVDSRYIYLGFQVIGAPGVNAGIVRVDTTNFTTTGAALLDLTSIVTNTIAIDNPRADASSGRIYFCGSAKPDGITSEGFYLWLDPTNFTAAGVTVGPVGLFSLPGHGQASYFVDSGHLWQAPNADNVAPGAVPLAQLHKDTFAVLQTWDFTVYGDRATDFAGYPFFDGSRFAYFWQFAGSVAPGTSVLILDTQNPGAPDFWDLKANGAAAGDAWQGNACMDSAGFIYLPPFGGAAGNLIRLRAKTTPPAFMPAKAMGQAGKATPVALMNAAPAAGAAATLTPKETHSVTAAAGAGAAGVLRAFMAISIPDATGVGRAARFTPAISVPAARATGAAAAFAERSGKQPAFAAGVAVGSSARVGVLGALVSVQGLGAASTFIARGDKPAPLGAGVAVGAVARVDVLGGMFRAQAAARAGAFVARNSRAELPAAGLGRVGGLAVEGIPLRRVARFIAYLPLWLTEPPP